MAGSLKSAGSHRIALAGTTTFYVKETGEMVNQNPKHPADQLQERKQDQRENQRENKEDRRDDRRDEKEDRRDDRRD